VYEFSFWLDEPHVEVFRGGGKHTIGIPQKTPKATPMRSNKWFEL